MRTSVRLAVQGRLFAGDFEIHLTVDGTGDELSGLEDFARAHGLKCAFIVLDRGRTPWQPMITQRAQGTLAEAADSAEATAAGLSAAGFRVVRTKVEATPWSDGVPRDDSAARSLPGDQYFEHHVKLLLPADAELAALARLAERHGAHVSRNARRRRDDGPAERFVTQRCRGVGDTTASCRLSDLTAELTAAGWEIISSEREFVVYDSAQALDAGWIREAEAAR
ncbi:hypothetical protein [Streptomyces alkaliterrae]|uniref:Uncharacterized protein n=1 Tax=Streptomyces alkaliterrae TaxID=2213162 RepID=A0A5P0YLQ2_9ACTN|nr:hypothetical protein [Streptomyces alkaliterrae]MBB1252032.1 hypothetical protein [Streptomyces alkaliterrae]MBB1257463.1 hypothetical protein [Streptomyces alkaliterrae]MQS00352.1 hypothetical protein [Streptomyces alkaliterrae]